MSFMPVRTASTLAAVAALDTPSVPALSTVTTRSVPVCAASDASISPMAMLEPVPPSMTWLAFVVLAFLPMAVAELLPATAP